VERIYREESVQAAAKNLAERARSETEPRMCASHCGRPTSEHESTDRFAARG
jgi:hypothetical protein